MSGYLYYNSAMGQFSTTPQSTCGCGASSSSSSCPNVNIVVAGCGSSSNVPGSFFGGPSIAPATLSYDSNFPGVILQNASNFVVGGADVQLSAGRLIRLGLDPPSTLSDGACTIGAYSNSLRIKGYGPSSSNGRQITLYDDVYVPGRFVASSAFVDDSISIGSNATVNGDLYVNGTIVTNAPVTSVGRTFLLSSAFETINVFNQSAAPAITIAQTLPGAISPFYMLATGFSSIDPNATQFRLLFMAALLNTDSVFQTPSTTSMRMCYVRYTTSGVGVVTTTRDDYPFTFTELSMAKGWAMQSTPWAPIYDASLPSVATRGIELQLQYDSNTTCGTWDLSGIVVAPSTSIDYGALQYGIGNIYLEVR